MLLKREKGPSLPKETLEQSSSVRSLKTYAATRPATLEPLTGELNVDHVGTVQCFLGNLGLWHLSWHAPPTSTLLQTKHSPHANGIR